MLRKIVAIVCCMIFILSANAQDTFYGSVGEYISLPEPKPPVSTYTVMSMSYSTTSEHLYIAPGTSRVKILSYFSYKEVVECYYSMVRQYYVAGRLYEDWQTGTQYYYIACNGSAPDPEPDPDPDPGTLTATTVEGVTMVFSLNDDGTAYTGVGYGGTAVPLSTSGTVTIPDRVQGHSVYGIGAFSFYQCNKISRIIIPNSVRIIAQAAFRESGIIDVEFSNSVTRIDINAFEDCNNLEKLELPSSLTHLYGQAINNCSILKEVVLPSSLTYIGEWAIWNCLALEKITCLSPTPLSLSKDPVDYSIYNHTTLYVPKGSASLYRAAEYWNKFNTIREIGGEDNIQGDVNGDGDVNGTDFVALANIILKKSPEKPSADVNGDGEVNGTDFVKLANIILKKE